MDMGLRVKVEKVKLVIHIRSLNGDTLARKVYEEQREKGWPGLALETKNICAELRIEDCNTTKLPKKEYIGLLSLACMVKDEETLRGMALGKVKCERIMDDTYGRKKYFTQSSIKGAREMYRTRVGLQDFAGNYGHDKRFSRTEWLCRCGTAREEERHLTAGACPVYGDLAEGVDLESDEELKDFFQAVLARREALEEMEETPGEPCTGGGEDEAARPLDSC
jgi:hypothetical protein